MFQGLTSPFSVFPASILSLVGMLTLSCWNYIVLVPVLLLMLFFLIFPCSLLPFSYLSINYILRPKLTLERQQWVVLKQDLSSLTRDQTRAPFCWTAKEVPSHVPFLFPHLAACEEQNATWPVSQMLPDMLMWLQRPEHVREASGLVWRCWSLS